MPVSLNYLLQSPADIVGQAFISCHATAAAVHPVSKSALQFGSTKEKELVMVLTLHFCYCPRHAVQSTLDVVKKTVFAQI